ncbi:hypothetical protein TPR58_18030 [Sphingomonas sp. HF-S3]|uniref:Lipoprotein n=1 Tax=Sphingomonas rustica TaxID=3103142 RepID=A0ABV0BBY9_9SPHN
MYDLKTRAASLGRIWVWLAALPVLGFCVVGCSQSQVGIADISESHDRWRSQSIAMQGLIVYEFENLGIYASCEDYSAHRSAVYLEWDEAGGVTKKDNRRMAVVTGELDHSVGTDDEVISTGKPAPGSSQSPKGHPMAVAAAPPMLSRMNFPR